MTGLPGLPVGVAGLGPAGASPCLEAPRGDSTYWQHSRHEYLFTVLYLGGFHQYHYYQKDEEKKKKTILQLSKSRSLVSKHDIWCPTQKTLKRGILVALVMDPFS